jgi:Phosphoserine aminotransferase
VTTGAWSEKALDEAKKLGETYEAASAKAGKFSSIPALSDLRLQADTAYLHLTSNNTISARSGVNSRNRRSAADCRYVERHPVAAGRRQQFSMIYAGAQKNLGPAGSRW